MGWGRFLLLGDLGQQMDLEEQRAELERMRRTAKRSESLQDDLARLQAENSELKLYLAALFKLLVAKGIATAEEIRSLVQQLDESDGRADKAFDGDVVTGET